MMKWRSLPSLALGFTVFAGILAAPSPSIANTSDYLCAQYQGVWTTWVKQPNGRLSPLVRWKNEQIPDWPPKKRCIEVSKRMQRLADNGLFNYMQGGYLERQPVICGVRRLGDNCSDRNLVLTLQPGDNPSQAIDKLLDISGRANNRVLQLSGNGSDDLKYYVGGQIYYNVNVFKQALVHAEPSLLPNQVTPVQ